jgi:hypothetical protein
MATGDVEQTALTGQHEIAIEPKPAVEVTAELISVINHPTTNSDHEKTAQTVLHEIASAAIPENIQRVVEVITETVATWHGVVSAKTGSGVGGRNGATVSGVGANRSTELESTEQQKTGGNNSDGTEITRESDQFSPTIAHPTAQSTRPTNLANVQQLENDRRIRLQAMDKQTESNDNHNNSNNKASGNSDKHNNSNSNSNSNSNNNNSNSNNTKEYNHASHKSANANSKFTPYASGNGRGKNQPIRHTQANQGMINASGNRPTAAHNTNTHHGPETQSLATVTAHQPAAANANIGTLSIPRSVWDPNFHGPFYPHPGGIIVAGEQWESGFCGIHVLNTIIKVTALSGFVALKLEQLIWLVARMDINDLNTVRIVAREAERVENHLSTAISINKNIDQLGDGTYVPSHFVDSWQMVKIMESICPSTKTHAHNFNSLANTFTMPDFIDETCENSETNTALWFKPSNSAVNFSVEAMATTSDT